jgi:cellulose synthase/poly-beta-1,6-N-acetylglucosamine synthase-like glycosyltransferase
MQTASGDDDLIVSKMSQKTKVGIVLHPESFVFSEGKKSWKEYARQKVRHISTAVYYKSYHKVLLTVFAMSQIAFYLLLITASAIDVISTLSAFILLLTKWGGQQMLQNEIFRKLQHQELQRYFPVLDISMAIYYMAMPLVSLFTHKTWK